MPAATCMYLAYLVLVVFEHLQQFFLGHDQTLELLLLLGDLANDRLEGLPIGLLDSGTVGQCHLVVETGVNGRLSQSVLTMHPYLKAGRENKSNDSHIHLYKASNQIGARKLLLGRGQSCARTPSFPWGR